MSTNEEKGFLSDAMARSVLDFRIKIKAWATLYKSLNAFAYAQLMAAAPKVDTSDDRSTYIFALFYRLLNTYQAVLILIEHGLDSDAKALLRNQLETYFVLQALVLKKTFIKIYITSDIRQRIRLLNNVAAARKILLRKGQKPANLMSAAQVKEMRKEITEMEKKLPKRRVKKPKRKIDGKPLAIRKIARRAKQVVMYMQHYCFLCSFAHPTPIGMAEFMQRNEAGKISKIRTGRNDSDAIFNLRNTALFMLAGVDAFRSYFDLPIEAELTAFATNYKALLFD